MGNKADKIDQIVQSLLKKPDLAFGVASHLLGANLMGPWVPHGAGKSPVAARLNPHGGVLVGVWLEGPRATYGTVYAHENPAPSIARAMDLADEDAESHHQVLIGRRPFRVATPWAQRDDKWIRLHDVPSKSGQWPRVAVVLPKVAVDNVKQQTRGEIYPWEITVQGTMSDEGLSGFGDTVDEAKQRVDDELERLGWFVPVRKR